MFSIPNCVSVIPSASSPLYQIPLSPPFSKGETGGFRGVLIPKQSDFFFYPLSFCVLLTPYYLPDSQKKWRGEDSNLRRLRQQIYSLPPLATRVPLHITKNTKLENRNSENQKSVNGCYFPNFVISSFVCIYLRIQRT